MKIFKKLKTALSFSSNKIAEGIDNIFYKKKIDQDTLDQLEELLIRCDLSIQVAANVINEFKDFKFKEEATIQEIKLELSKLISNILDKNAQNFELNKNSLNIILMCGVNGNGKTTTIGKLCHFYISQGKKIGVAACDTFRAAAVDQIEAWALKTKAKFYKGSKEQDPASVAYEAVIKAKEDGLDILFIDTAGRLQNYKNLMAELTKISKVIKKVDSDALKYSLLVIDATIGQNAYSQVEEFQKFAGINGLIITKLDGSAKAGVIVGIMQKYKLPVYFVGVGEKDEDIELFNAKSFAENLVGIDN